MVRILDLQGHPSSDRGCQLFQLALDGVDDLSPTDILRLTDRATGDISYWRVAPPSDTGSLEQTERGWRGVLSQTELDA